MTLRPYDRQAAVEYAHRWAYFRNPNYCFVKSKPL